MVHRTRRSNLLRAAAAAAFNAALLSPSSFTSSGASAVRIEMREARIEMREEMGVIAENEQRLSSHISSLFGLLEAAKEVLVLTSEGKPVRTVDITAKMPPDVKAAFEKLNAMKHAGGTQTVGAVLQNAMGPALMVPMLQEMYEKFKGDIKRANAQEQRAKDRVAKQQKEYLAFQNEGKTYLLEQKQRVIAYYKKQQEIQHHHYHTMLKMAHAMMERIKRVKGMCADAAAGKKLTKKQLEELRLVAPSGAGKVL
mmetsp:Transcript_18626/g.46496  ORF Transcript_18626/g.46496 Transcript_18626/m.46496 type:complete len:254 (-) Transcript_18626:225-986(-)